MNHADAIKASLLRVNDVLIIEGPSGCGKTTLARLIANNVPGKVIECCAQDLHGRFLRPLAESPDVLIVEEIEPVDLATLKNLACAETVGVELKGEDCKFVPVPRYIIATRTNDFVRDMRVSHLRRPLL